MQIGICKCKSGLPLIKLAFRIRWRPLQIGETLGLSLRGWLESVEETAAYLVIKSNASQEEDLRRLLNALYATIDLQGFYVHMNGNNLALLPDAVNKRAAAAVSYDAQPNMGARWSLV